MNIAVIGTDIIGKAFCDYLGQYKYQKLFDHLYVFNDKLTSKIIKKLSRCDYVFLTQSIQYNSTLNQLDKQEIYSTCQILSDHHYGGCVVIKSTIEPETTEDLVKGFPILRFVYNPEFSFTHSAFEDLCNREQIILGFPTHVTDRTINKMKNLWHVLEPNVPQSICTATEAEVMKIFTNSFCAMKIQFMTEMYSICQRTWCNYETVRDMMIQNGTMLSTYTQVPGPDHHISFGGFHLPRDMNALRSYLERKKSPHELLDACIMERNLMRE